MRAGFGGMANALMLWLVTLWPQCLSSLQNWSPERAVQELVFQKSRQFEPCYSIPACGLKSITRRKAKKDRQFEPYYSIPACGSKSITMRKAKKDRQFEPYYSIPACGSKSITRRKRKKLYGKDMFFISWNYFFQSFYTSRPVACNLLPC